MTSDRSNPPKAIARVDELYRYPVKGLSPQPMAAAELDVGREIAHDRSWAIEDHPGKFDPNAPRHLPKINFAMLMRHEGLATLETRFDPATTEVSLSRDGAIEAVGELRTANGRATIEAYLATLLAGRLRGTPKIVTAADHTFSNVSMRCLHVITRASIEALETAVGQRIDPLRFRANVILSDAPAFSEFSWIGQTLRLGEADVEVVKRTERCAATDVNPQTGARDLDMPGHLRRAFGHTDFGVYVRVVKGGRVARGDTVIG